MAVDFKKLLPVKMRSSMWGDFIKAYQNIDTQIRTGLVNPIFDQYTQQATEEELVRLASMFGFNISILKDYTASIEYLKKEVEFIIPRIKSKTTKKAYTYTACIFNMICDVFPMMTSSSGSLSSKLTTVYDPESQLELEVVLTDQEGDNLYYNELINNWTLDGNFKLDNYGILDYSRSVYGDPKETGLVEAFTDTDNAVYTDGVVVNNHGTLITSVTRNISFCYKPLVIDYPTEWISFYTNKAMKNDIDQLHKATEVVYYEPWIVLDTNNDTTLTNKNYYNYDNSISGQVYSISSGELLLNAQYIQFGTGSHWSSISGLSPTISGVSNFSYFIPRTIISGETIPNVPSGVGGWNYFSDATSISMDIDFIISEKNKFTEFSEFAILDSTSGCIYYATFPTIKWYQNMYNNIRVTINLV